jgi:hypothetical protein
MRILGILGALALVFVGLLWAAGSGTFGTIDSARTEPAASPRSAERQARVADRQAEAVPAPKEPAGAQILFGDLHVHSTISGDAFFMNLPAMGGGGAMTPADACDFARQCAALDFWSINDHANVISPSDWRNTIEAIRSCNARAGDAANPDTVAFLGWEWTQAGMTPETHYGHKNVVLAETDDANIPTRPIAAKEGSLPLAAASPLVRGALGLVDDRAWDLSRRIAETADAEVCPEGHVRELPTECLDVAPTPAQLFRKLDEWGHEAIVIPHGTAWGIYTPPGSSWDKQLQGAMHDSDRQTLIEVYSGHGDSEVHRDWRGVEFAEDGSPVCPKERPDYLPMCRRAGQIIRERCLAEGEPEAECEVRAESARQHAVAAGKAAADTVPESRAADWLDAGQCRDCNQPSFSYIPGSSAQYIAALGNFDADPAAPRRFRMGFMASSDNHSARPGTGFKEIRAMTDVGVDDPNRMSPLLERALLPSEEVEPDATLPGHSQPFEAVETTPFQLGTEVERVTSFQYTGGLVAVHAEGRDRRSIWSALRRNAVYGTSGPRILLWFDLLTGDRASAMGTELESDSAPTFRVRAVGSFEQLPGCPAEPALALGEDRLQRLCLGECYHPSDVRRPITRIEMVRIRPQKSPEEDVARLIDDPWRTFTCPGDAAGCTATFSDPEFPDSGRDALYYARVFEAPLPSVNGAPLNCSYDEEGRCVEVAPCGLFEECLRPDEPRAWSSPIWLDHPAAQRSR